jgi:hypothetical protein
MRMYSVVASQGFRISRQAQLHPLPQTFRVPSVSQKLERNPKVILLLTERRIIAAARTHEENALRWCIPSVT